jgi:hypothetical protein
VFGREGEPTLSPLAKLQSISSVYFPQFEAKIKELEIAARNYEAWMLAEGAKRLSGEPLPLTVQNFADAYGPFQSKANDLLHDLSEHARREFQ